MLVRLLYASRAADQLGQEGLSAILKQSKCNNPKLGITGVLCFSDHTFMQVLEGGREAVSRLYNRIVGDPRHQAARRDPEADRAERGEQVGDEHGHGHHHHKPDGVPRAGVQRQLTGVAARIWAQHGQVDADPGKPRIRRHAALEGHEWRNRAEYPQHGAGERRATAGHQWQPAGPATPRDSVPGIRCFVP